MGMSSSRFATNTGFGNRSKNLQRVGRERRPDLVQYDGKAWTELSDHNVFCYYLRPNVNSHFSLQSLPCELVLNVISRLDVDSFYRFCKTSSQFEVFLHDYRSMSRFLKDHIDLDLNNGRFEMVIFKHRHGIRCSYVASRNAMYLALKARHYRFVKYLLSVGKTLDTWHVLEIVRKDGIGELEKLLSIVHPTEDIFNTLEITLRGRISDNTVLDKYRKYISKK